MPPAWQKAFARHTGGGALFRRVGQDPAPDGVVSVSIGRRGDSSAEYATVGPAGPFHFRRDIAAFSRTVALAEQFGRPLPWLEWLASEEINSKLDAAACGPPDNVDVVVAKLVDDYAAMYAATARPDWRADVLAQVFGCTSAMFTGTVFRLEAPGTVSAPIAAVAHYTIVRKVMEERRVADCQGYLLWVVSRQRFECYCRRTKSNVQLAPIAVRPGGLVELTCLDDHEKCCPKPAPVAVDILGLARRANVTSRRMAPVEALVKIAAQPDRPIELHKVFSGGAAIVDARAENEVFRAGATAFLAGVNGIVWVMRDILATRGIVFREKVASTSTLTAGTPAAEQMALLFKLVSPRGGGDRQGAIKQFESACRSTGHRPKPCLPGPPQWNDHMAPSGHYGGARTSEFVCVYSNPADRMQLSRCGCAPGDTPASVAIKSVRGAFGGTATAENVAAVLPPCMVNALADPSGYWKRWELAMNCRDVIASLASPE